MQDLRLESKFVWWQICHFRLNSFYVGLSQFNLYVNFLIMSMMLTSSTGQDLNRALDRV